MRGFVLLLGMLCVGWSIAAILDGNTWGFVLGQFGFVACLLYLLFTAPR